MTRREYRSFIKDVFFIKPRGKWNVIYGIWRGFIIAWWNTLVIWAGSASNQLTAVFIIYGLLLIALFFIYIFAKGK